VTLINGSRGSAVAHTVKGLRSDWKFNDRFIANLRLLLRVPVQELGKSVSILHALMETRKLCYGCPENFRDSLTTPTATIPNIFHGLLFRSTLRIFLQNFKSVALPVPEIIGGTQKIWAVHEYAHAPFSSKFLMDFLFGLAL